MNKVLISVKYRVSLKKNPYLKGHTSLDIKTIILANVSFNSQYVQISSKYYLSEISHSVLKLKEIFSRKFLRETSKNCVKS